MGGGWHRGASHRNHRQIPRCLVIDRRDACNRYTVRLRARDLPPRTARRCSQPSPAHSNDFGVVSREAVLIGAALAPTFSVLLAALGGVGLTTVAAQLLTPLDSENTIQVP